MRIAITGGSGSLGSRLIETLVRRAEDGSKSMRVVTFTRDEGKRAAMQRKYENAPFVKVYAGDVRDGARLRDIFDGCDVVIHAAARKVVSGFADEPREMLLTNVEGTRNVMAACRDVDVSKLMFVSSDKAVQPENVYGVSKAMAEHLVVSENARSVPQGCAMSVIRYGNVLASRGSVVQVWADALRNGTPLRVSDRRMTRFWLTLDMAARYVLAATDMMLGGEIFVPELHAAPLTSLAASVAPGHELVDMGVRPGGEKLHESLLSDDEMRRVVRVPVGDIAFYIVKPTGGFDWHGCDVWPGDYMFDPSRGYRSDTWPMQLTQREMNEMVAAS